MGDKGDTGSQEPSGSGDSADFSTVLLLDTTQIMTGNLHMYSKRLLTLGIHQVQHMPRIKSMLIHVEWF